MKGIIHSLTGLLIGCIACFFVFALQGMKTEAVATGIACLSGLILHALIEASKSAPNPIWSPSRSRRRKNKIIAGRV